MSKSISTAFSNKTNTFIPSQIKTIKNKKSINDIAISECQKLYSRNCAKCNQYVLNQLKKDKLNIYLNNLKPKDLTIIGKLLTKFFYFKHIELSPFDPEKEDCSRKKKNRLKEIPTTQTGLAKKNKPKNSLEKEKFQNITKLLMSISRYLSLSDNIISLSLNSISISKESARYLSQGLLDNKTIQGLNINFSIISLESYEILLKSLLKHEMLKYLDLSNNNFSDKYGEMVALIISYQSQRRDQALWASGLRNEAPQINEYSKGLVSINLRGNKLGSYSAECISKALSHDQYIRIIDISENNLDNPACKKFIHMMRKNNILLTVDLRENPGYDEAIYQRMIMKMSKNIRYLYQQFQNGDYTEEEFENLKEFIDISFFDVDIPQEIVDYYNGNIQDTLEDNGEELNDQIQLDNMNVMNDIQERAEEEEDDETNKTIKEKGESKTGQNLSLSNNKNTEEENKKLIEENQKLKQTIMELKSQNENNNKGKILIKPDDPNNIEANYSYIINLISELNEVMNNIEKIKNKSENKKQINNIQENIQKNNEDIYIQNEENNQSENIKINDNKVPNEQNVINNDNNIPQNENQEEENGNIMGQEINLENLEEKEEVEDVDREQEQELEQNEQGQIQNEENIQEKNNNENNIIQNKNSEINLEGVEIGEDEENDDEEINLDDLTEEEKMALLQQREILQKLQEEAEAKGEHFDVQEYLEMLEKQANEEEEEEGDNKEEDKINKSF